jgi:hypothetical protein
MQSLEPSIIISELPKAYAVEMLALFYSLIDLYCVHSLGQKVWVRHNPAVHTVEAVTQGCELLMPSL